MAHCRHAVFSVSNATQHLYLALCGHQTCPDRSEAAPLQWRCASRLRPGRSTLETHRSATTTASHRSTLAASKRDANVVEMDDLETNRADLAHVLIEVKPMGQNARQIGARDAFEQIEARVSDVGRGIQSGIAAVAESLPSIAMAQGWAVRSVEARFGVTLGYEGSVIISKVATEASFEVTVAFAPEAIA